MKIIHLKNKYFQNNSSYVVFVALFFVLFPAITFAQSNIEINKDDSIYRYHALESKLSYMEMNGSIITIAENKIPDSVENILAEQVKAIEQEAALENIKYIHTTEKQTDSMNKMENAMTKIGNSKLKHFFLGTNLGILRFQMVQMRDQNIYLISFVGRVDYDDEQQKLNQQIELSKEELIKVENFIKKQEKKFSLFGWFINSL